MIDTLIPLQQSDEFATCLEARGRRVTREAGGLVIHRRLAGIPVRFASRAPCTMASGLRDLSGIRLINAESVSRDLHTNGFVQLMTPATVAEWMISAPAQALRERLSGKWRSALVQSERSGLRLRLTHHFAAEHWLFQADRRQAKARNYQGLPHHIVLDWARLHSGSALLIEAFDGPLPVAGMIFLQHGNVATYQIAHATSSARRLNAHRLMLWRAVEHFKERGVTRIDLGVIDTEAAPGLARFKLGTGAMVRRLGGTWISIPGLSGGLAQLNATLGQRAHAHLRRGG